MRAAPGGLIDGQLRPRPIQLAHGADWYVVDTGSCDLVGSGDLGMSDLKAVGAELRESGGPHAMFVCVARPREVEAVIGGRNRWGLRRILWSTTLSQPISPKIAAIARGARLAILPDRGLVWVDGERLFSVDEPVPLPWTDPPVELLVVRPKTVRAAMALALGPNAPKRANLNRV